MPEGGPDADGHVAEAGAERERARAGAGRGRGSAGAPAARAHSSRRLEKRPPEVERQEGDPLPAAAARRPGARLRERRGPAPPHRAGPPGRARPETCGPSRRLGDGHARGEGGRAQRRASTRWRAIPASVSRPRTRRRLSEATEGGPGRFQKRLRFLRAALKQQGFVNQIPGKPLITKDLQARRSRRQAHHTQALFRMRNAPRFAAPSARLKSPHSVAGGSSTGLPPVREPVSPPVQAVPGGSESGKSDEARLIRQALRRLVRGRIDEPAPRPPDVSAMRPREVPRQDQRPGPGGVVQHLGPRLGGPGLVLAVA